MANLSNIMAALVAFFIAAVLIYTTNEAVWAIISNISDSAIKLIAIIGWFAVVLLVLVYFPLHLLTAEDATTLS